MELLEPKNIDEKITTKEFIKSSFESILKLHEEILASKDENIKQLKEDNMFLKELVISLQEINSEDRETIEVLTKQIKSLQDELEFTKRKYKLMWNQVVENYKR